MTDIFFFSGTGNSYVVAKDIAKRIDANLIPIASTIHEKIIKNTSEALGIVFPVYYETYGGVPIIVEKFIQKLSGINGIYIFAVCTYGGGSIVTLSNIQKSLERVGGKLSSGITVNMPENVADSRFNNPEIQRRMFKAWKENVDRISNFISARLKGRLDSPNVLVGRLWSISKIIGLPALWIAKRGTLRALQKGSFTSLMSYRELIPRMDMSFYTNDACNGCGLCTRICPVDNIKIQEMKPVWQHRCELCLACFHWCPRNSILSHAFPKSIKYHHPEISAADLIKAKEQRKIHP